VTSSHLVPSPHQSPESGLKTASVYAQFARLAVEAPHLPAVVSASQSVTYAELDLLARRIAAGLSALPHPERPIALLMEEGVLLFATILGASLSGRVFIPLEITGAHSWLARVIAASDAAFLISDAANGAASQQIAPSGVVALSAEALALSSDLFPGQSDADPGTIACVIYTSGSTGQPKGVAFDHGFLLHRVEARRQRYRFQPGHRFGHLRSCGYSAGLNTALAALLNGAALHVFQLRTEGMHRLAPWLSAQAITHVSITSSLFRSWLATLPENFHFPHLKALSAAAEPLFGSDLTRIARHLTGDWRLLHSLSSTETGVITSAIFDAGSVVPDGALAVGVPIDGVDIRLEDEKGEAVPQGEVGEIVVHARYLAAGYWKDPESTGARFAKDGSGRRLYRTRDYGRYLSDGTLEYLGRRDRKIKLRGYSVEPYEIECALLRLPDVRDAAIVVEGEGDAASLHAFVSGPKDFTAEGARKLRALLSQDLPPQLVPVRIAVLPALPLTPRGKIDRNQLEKRLPRKDAGSGRKPSDAIEQMLYNIWTKTMHRKDFGVDDNLPDIGASSLHIFSVFSWLDALGWNLPPSLIFEAPTIVQQADVLRRNAPSNTGGKVVAFRTEGEKPPLFLLHARKGDILYARELFPLLRGGRPVYGLRAPVLDGSERVPRTIETMAAAFIADMKRIQPKGSYNLCGYSFGGILAFEIARQLHEAGEGVAFLGLIDTLIPSKSRYARRGMSGPQGIRKLGMALWSAGVAVSYWPDELRLRLGRPISPVRRLNYYEYIYQIALRRYRRKPYAGGATLFSSKDNTEKHRRNWGPMVEGRFEIVEFAGSHVDIIWPPLNAMLAEAIDAILDAIETSSLPECPEPRTGCENPFRHA
jgi:amino acid adenylation domain-containing protein